MNIKKNQGHNVVMEAMTSIFTASKESQFEDSCFENIEKEITNVMKYLNVNQLDAVLFSVVSILKMTGKNTDVSELSKHFNMTSIEFLPYKDELEAMIKKGLLIRKHNRRYFDDYTRSRSYTIDENVIYAIIHNLPCPRHTEKSTSSSMDVFELVYDLLKYGMSDELEKFEMQLEIKQLLHENKQLPIIDHLTKQGIEESYLIVLIFLLWKNLSGNLNESMEDLIELLSDSGSERIKMTQSIMSGNDPLTKLDLIELKEGRFMNDMEVHLTENASHILELEKITLKSGKNKNQKTITPNDIAEKKLFYNVEETEKIERIKNVLVEKNYQSIIKRLNENNMVQGMNILFYGAPGTGKTESVLQLAKSTGREIMKIEISQTKSMWFGESEKIIKRIFRNYEVLRQQLNKTPILFFNEADAILGKRKNVDNGNTAQTENAIQNILLEELENFKGIFMATTNLTNNLDKAFDRRFLFKVEFKNPEMDAAANIWKSKLPFLTKKECHFLAEEFKFSGGQIDNVVRKSEIDFVLNNKKSTLEKIVDYCLGEELASSDKQFGKIGF